jgi:hypothetical protein
MLIFATHRLQARHLRSIVTGLAAAGLSSCRSYLRCFLIGRKRTTNVRARGKGWITSLFHVVRPWPPCLSTNVKPIRGGKFDASASENNV